jgi:hypothetical protein
MKKQPEPKYKIGQTIYKLNSNKVETQEITGILLRPNGGFSYIFELTSDYCVSFSYGEKELFASKEELLKSL